MDFEKLRKREQDACAALRQLWTVTGKTAAEMERDFGQFFSKVEAVMLEFVETETRVKAELEKQIDAACAEEAALCKALERAAFARVFDEGMNLRLRLEVLGAALKALRDEKAQREDAFKALLLRVGALCNELGKDVPEGLREVGADLTAARMASIQSWIAEATSEMNARVEYAQECVSALCVLYQQLSLDESERQPIDAKVEAAKRFADANKDYDIANLGVHHSVMDTLHTRRKELSSLLLRREQQLKTLAKQINELWQKLSVSAEERKAFLARCESLGGTSARSIAACEAELEALTQRFRASLKDLIPLHRQRLFDLWNQAMVSEDERRRFLPAFCDLFTEDTLVAVQQEIERTERRLASMLPLLDMVRERRNILDEKIVFDEECKDPARFKKAGRMIYEEKFRNKLKNYLPKLEQKLRAAISEWEVANGPFLVGGKRMAEVLDDDERAEKEAAEAAKRNKLKAKENAAQNAAAAATPARAGPTPAKRAAPAAAAKKQTGDDANFVSLPSM